MSARNTTGLMSLGDHLEELRKRVIHALYGLAPIVLVSLVFGKPLLRIINAPVVAALHRAQQPEDIIQTGMMETFGSYCKVSLISAIVLGSPWILYQLWLFVSPGLYGREKRFVYFLLPLATVLTLAGVLFFYYVILPVILAFMIHFGADLGSAPPPRADATGVVLGHAPVLNADPTSAVPGDYWINSERGQVRFCVENGRIMSMSLHSGEGIRSEFRVSEIVKTMMMFSLAFAGGFQMPVVVLLLGWAGMIDVAFLKKYRKHAILAISIIAALLTPADPFSMILMMIPLYLLYELGAILLKWFPASRVAGNGPRRGEAPLKEDVETAVVAGREPADAGDP